MGSGGSSLSDAENACVCRGEDYREHLGGAQLLADRPPKGVDPLIQEVLFDGTWQK
jgi:hypothetical protein